MRVKVPGLLFFYKSLSFYLYDISRWAPSVLFGGIAFAPHNYRTYQAK